MNSLTWPAGALPQWKVAGVFPMTPSGRTQSYIAETIALHLHDYRGTIQIGRERFSIEPGDITLSPGGVASHYDLKESGTHLCIHFASAGRARSRRIRLPPHLRLGPQTSAARDRFWRVIDYTRQAGATAESLAGHAASAALQELLLWLALRQGKGATPRRHSRLDQALKKLGETIDASVARPVSMADLAAGTGLTPAYLARAFAQRYGMTVQHYLLQRRIELARHLLGTSELLIFEIGAAVGLPDAQYFNKQFRRIAGVSPLAYRRGLATVPRASARKAQTRSFSSPPRPKP